MACFLEIPIFKENDVYPDQTPHSAASDLGLHCTPKSLYRFNRMLGINGSSTHGEQYNLSFFVQEELSPNQCQIKGLFRKFFVKIYM